MNEKDVRRLLLSLPVPDEQRAEERTWDTVRRAFGDHEPVPARRRQPWKLLAVAVAAAALIGVAVSPVGSEIGGWIRDKVGRERVVGVTPAKPALVALPASGRLLVRRRPASGSLATTGRGDASARIRPARGRRTVSSSRCGRDGS